MAARGVVFYVALIMQESTGIGGEPWSQDAVASVFLFLESRGVEKPALSPMSSQIFITTRGGLEPLCVGCASAIFVDTGQLCGVVARVSVPPHH